MQLVVGLDINDPNAFRHLHATQAAGKGLFLNMWMVEHPVTQNFALAIYNPPVVRVVIPARVSMLQGHTHRPAVAATVLKVRSKDLYLIGIRCVERSQRQKAGCQCVRIINLFIAILSTRKDRKGDRFIFQAPGK